MINENILTELKQLKQSIEEVSVYDLNVYSSMELYSRVAKKLNEVIQSFDKLGVTVSEAIIEQNNDIQYLLNEGLTNEVINKINDMVNDGTMDLIINQNVLEELNSQIKDIENIKADKSTTASIQQQINNLVLGAVGDGNNAEVVQARGDKTTLNDRMDYFDDNIFDKQPTIDTVKPNDTITGKKISVNTTYNLAQYNLYESSVIKIYNVSPGQIYYINGTSGDNEDDVFACYGKGLDSAGNIQVVGYVTNIGTGSERRTVENYKITVPAEANKMYVVGDTYLNVPALAKMETCIKTNALSMVKNLKDKKPNLLHCMIKDNVVYVGTKYNNQYDMWKSIEKRQFNSLPMISKIWKVTNTSKDVKCDLFDSLSNPFFSVYSEFIGPYNGLRCLTQSGGVLPDSWEWAGGSHTLTYNDKKLKTATNIRFDTFVNNMKVTEFNGEADSIKVVIVNNIMGVNTIKADNSGVNVLQETVIYEFKTTGEILVDVEIETLENCCCTTYHGFQMEVGDKYNKCLFVDDDTHKQWFTNAYGTEVLGGKYSENNTCREIIYKDDNGNYCKMWVDANYGLGSYKLMEAESRPCKHSEYNKGYLWLIPKYIELNKGDILRYRGGYNWFFINS